MIRAALLFLLAGTAAPALAQHAGHTAPPPMSPPGSGASCTPEHAAMGHCTLPAEAEPAPPAPPSTCTPEHAAMGHCTMPAGNPPATASDPHAGHQMPGADLHAGHAPATSAPALAPPPAAAFSGPEHAADLVFGTAVMAEAREDLRREHGGLRASKLLIDQLETRFGGGSAGYFLNAEGWYGGDINKLWLKSEIEGEGGRSPDQAEVQALWSRAIDPWFDLQAGVRFDANRGPNRTHLVLGVQGLAPYWWEVDGALFLSNRGELTARAEAEYDLRITQKLVLQPRVEADLSAQDIEELGVGAGLSTAGLGLRLRYQISQQFAPYVGASFERTFGRTRDFRREEGDDAGGLKAVAGLRWWF